VHESLARDLLCRPPQPVGRPRAGRRGDRGSRARHQT